MGRQFPLTLLLVVVSLAVMGSSAAKADQTIEAGQTLTLKEDLVLSGEDSLDIKGTPERRCTLLGNGYRIHANGPWTGNVRIRHCDIRQLGSPAKMTDDGRRIASEFPAIDLTITGKGSLVVENCDFDGSAAVHVQNDGQSTTTFRAN